MKGRKTFTSKEADEIRTLINKKLISDGETQKRIRNDIRDIGFYWTDFYSRGEREYDVDSFDALIESQKITIIG